MWKFLRNRYKKKLGPTLCLAKWTQSNIYLASGTTHSCHHPIPHKIPLIEISDNPSSLHNTSYKIKQRQDMLDGVKPNECSYCWKIEEQGHISDRITKSFCKWSRPFYNEILDQGSAGSDPKYLEVSFDNTCNLKCSYCGPAYSSKWVEELKQFGPWLDNHHGFDNILNREYNPYIEAFWKWWPKLYKNLITFRITGGEPLLSKHTYKVLDKLKQNPNKKLNLGINTNLSVPDNIIDKFIDQVKDVEVKKLVIHTSCDAYGSSAEYARNGLNYNKWLLNCNRILTELPNAKLDIMITYNIFSVTSFLDFLKDIKKLKTKPWYKKSRVTVSISYLRNPSQLAIWALPKSYCSYLEQQVEYMKSNKFTATEINQLNRILTLFKNYDDFGKKDLAEQFKLFVKEHDKRRNTNFFSSVPDMEYFKNES